MRSSNYFRFSEEKSKLFDHKYILNNLGQFKDHLKCEHSMHIIGNKKWQIWNVYVTVISSLKMCCLTPLKWILSLSSGIGRRLHHAPIKNKLIRETFQQLSFHSIAFYYHFFFHYGCLSPKSPLELCHSVFHTPTWSLSSEPGLAACGWCVISHNLSCLSAVMSIRASKQSATEQTVQFPLSFQESISEFSVGSTSFEHAVIRGNPVKALLHLRFWN